MCTSYPASLRCLAAAAVTSGASTKATYVRNGTSTGAPITVRWNVASAHTRSTLATMPGENDAGSGRKGGQVGAASARAAIASASTSAQRYSRTHGRRVRHSDLQMTMPIAIVVLALFTFTSPVTASASGIQPALSSDQRRRLAGGEVVILDVLPPGGNVKATQGGTAIALVHASADAVWRLLVDYRGHSGLYPRV